MEEQVPKRNVAGGSTREMARKRAIIWLSAGFVACLGLVVILWANWSNRKKGDPFIIAGCFVALAILGRGILPEIEFFQRREDDAARGAEAEERVGAILERLPL